jgi:hypothetical protein
MSHPELDADLAAALQVLGAELGPLQVLDVHPTPPRRRPATALAPSAGPQQPSLFAPGPEPATSTSTTGPLGHIPPRRRWREVPRLAGDPATDPGRDPRPTAPPDTCRRTT